MCTHTWNKMLVTSFALLAAGLLACVAAVIDALAPHGTLTAFLALTALLGLACWAVMAGLNWTCETCDEYLTWHSERVLSAKHCEPTATKVAHGWHGQ